MDEEFINRGTGSDAAEWPTGKEAVEWISRAVLSHKARVLSAFLLSLMAINLLSAISQKSITNDEIVHIPAGYYHLVDGYFQINNEHPPLVKMWAALPLLFIQPEEASRNSPEKTGRFFEITWSYHQYFWSNNRLYFESISFWTRAMMIPFAIGLGMVIFFFTQKLFGEGAALLAVALYTLEPTVLAHSRIVHTDIPAAFIYLLFFFALMHYLKNPTIGKALIVAFVAALAFLIKFSMIVLLPVLLVLVFAGCVFAKRLNLNRKRFALHIGMGVCVMLLVINATYYFHRPALEPADVAWVQARSPETASKWLTFFNVGSKVLPTYFLFGQYNVMLHNSDGHPSSLLGQHASHGWWYYFPVAFALKTTLAFLVVAAAGLAFSVWLLILKRDTRVLWLLIPFAIYAFLAVSSSINIGIRHFLPAYPYLFIAGGLLLDRMLHSQYLHRLAVVTVLLVFAFMSFEILRTHPHYVPYMNQLASTPTWWYLSDSNVEWGDDLKEVADYLKARGESEVRGAVLGGWGILGFYGVTYHEILPRPGVAIPETRYVIIGASFLNGSTIAVPADEQGRVVSEEERVNYLSEFRTATPEAVIGNSVYLYRVK